MNEVASNDTPPSLTPDELAALAQQIKIWGEALGFQQVGISDIQLEQAEQYFLDWLAQGFHGDMHYMERHGTRRSRPQELIPGTISVISARMDYLPSNARAMEEVLDDPVSAYISRYALGRDYHKVIRARLAKLAQQIEQTIGALGYRVFTDSAPVLEKPLAEKAGLGWQGKHTNILNRHAGSWFFLGEIFVDIALPSDTPTRAHCGSCQRCIDICPTQAIVAPYQLDGRRCISYLTIEMDGPIPEPFRRAMGNRIYGCDDCQIVCPWNRYAQASKELDFAARHNLDNRSLCELFSWDEATFLERMQGSAIRRIGHWRWLRNIAVALGNIAHAEASSEADKTAAVQALQQQASHPDAVIREHVRWALQQFEQVQPSPSFSQLVQALGQKRRARRHGQ
ncbi:MAG: tRNA epoxyqueuosine(34) reductase QueG [Xanthomonadales bacterium]|nr:tRNA epoxyqueuosine(34) reductase QueG [Xanthomonadales bacterium]